MRKLRTKYRLFFLILLPFVATIGFVADIFWSKYHTLDGINTIIVLSEIGNNISMLTRLVQLEKTYSLLKVQNIKNPEEFHEFNNLRYNSDRLALVVKNSIMHDIDINQKLQHSYINNLFHTFDQIVTQRELIDTDKITRTEVQEYFDDVQNELIKILSNIVDNIQVINNRDVAEAEDLFQNFFLQLVLMHMRIDAHYSKTLIFISLLDNYQIKKNEYDLFLNLLGRQQAYEQIYLEMAPDQYDIIYNPDQGTMLDNIKRMEHIILKSGPNINIDIDPIVWWEDLTIKINMLRDMETKLFNDNIEKSLALKATIHSTVIVMIILLVLAIGLTIYQLFSSLKLLVNQLQNETLIIVGSAKQILSSVHDVSNATAETASAVTETTTTIEELKHGSQEATNQANDAASVLEHTVVVLRESEHSIDETINGMHRIKDDMVTIHQTIVRLNEHNRAISDIISTVNDLAEQSHLLAINAAIEATKAEAQGKGFIVVAQEMRSLAEQSKQATIQIRNILYDIQQSISAAMIATDQGAKAVTDGVAQSALTNQSIHALSEKISVIVQAVSQIALSNQQQLLGVKQVTIAMESIQDATHQQVDNMHHIEARIQRLNEVGQTLETIIQEYQI